MRLLLGLLAVSALLSAAEAKYGKALTLKEPVPLATVMENPDQYAGKTVQVKGKIAEVCQMMGCWLELTDNDGHHLRFNAHEAGIEFPKDSAGKPAIAEGKLVKQELSREQAIEQAKEDAKDKGKPFDASKVKAGATYSIDGTGAVIQSN
jgi:hypothetical protein